MKRYWELNEAFDLLFPALWIDALSTRKTQKKRDRAIEWEKKITTTKLWTIRFVYFFYLALFLYGSYSLFFRLFVSSFSIGAETTLINIGAIGFISAIVIVILPVFATVIFYKVLKVLQVIN